MRISFTLPEGSRRLLVMAARRVSLETGRELTPSEIARALVQEVLIDDAASHGLTPATEGLN